MERNQEASVYVGNLDERVNEGLVWELMLQAGPVGMRPFVFERVAISLPKVNVFLPKDRVSGSHQNYGFVEFMTSEDADYAIKVCRCSKPQDTASTLR
jgi:splicing factor 3B subunit 4